MLAWYREMNIISVSRIWITWDSRALQLAFRCLEGQFASAVVDAILLPHETKLRSVDFASRRNLYVTQSKFLESNLLEQIPFFVRIRKPQTKNRNFTMVQGHQTGSVASGAVPHAGRTYGKPARSEKESPPLHNLARWLIVNSLKHRLRVSYTRRKLPKNGSRRGG